MNENTADRTVRVCRRLIAALAGGIAVFGIVVVLLVTGGHVAAQPQSTNVLLVTLAALAAGEIPVYFVVRGMVKERLRRRWSGQSPSEEAAAEMARAFGALTIIGAALAEGVSLFGLVALLIGGSWLAIIAPALGLLLLVALLPTQDRFRGFAAGVTGQHWG